MGAPLQPQSSAVPQPLVVLPELVLVPSPVASLTASSTSPQCGHLEPEQRPLELHPQRHPHRPNPQAPPDPSADSRPAQP
ncbi:unnamed protein product [Arabidopsis arenosa]|uniref:Uncharacterized protein n=1 Tax=Arabidopsis arenosa TaxID=38785 RepID=A0A8S1ZWT8_ARAAE|nr:unnamed protein product [Arabidopsis arenosa]